MPSLAGKVAIITGSGSGIGARIAAVSAERGAKVLVCATREEKAAKVVDSIRKAGGVAAGVWGDLAEETTPGRIVKAAIDHFGRVDVLVNNAAATSPAILAKDVNVTDLDGPTWQQVMAVNVIAPALLCKHAIPLMIAVGGGSIVMVSSGRGLQGDLGLPAYGASKAAILNLSLNVATQYGKQGIPLQFRRRWHGPDGYRQGHRQSGNGLPFHQSPFDALCGNHPGRSRARRVSGFGRCEVHHGRDVGSRRRHDLPCSTIRRPDENVGRRRHY
jgi:short-subunit dehydrogenase